MEIQYFESSEAQNGKYFFALFRTVICVFFSLLLGGCFSPPIMVAAHQGDTSSVRALLANGADVNTIDRGFTPLLASLQSGRLETARLLIEAGADVKVKNSEGMAALAFAAHGGYVDVVRSLIERGAELNVTTREGWTPLMLASIMNRDAVVDLLIEREGPLSMPGIGLDEPQ